MNNSIFKNVKYQLFERIKRSPRAWQIASGFLLKLTFLLPHDKSYFGFKHLAIEKEGLFLDIGANMGQSALGFRRLGINYKILSFEINPYHEPSLKKVKEKISNFDYCILGVGDEDAEVELYTPIFRGIPLHTAATTCFGNDTKESLEKYYPKHISKHIKYTKNNVRIVRLDKLALNPSIIKIDTEGSDFKVLLGLRETITKHKPYILLEYSPYLIENFKKIANEVSYEIYVYKYDKDCYIKFEEISDIESFQSEEKQLNLFFIPSGKISRIKNKIIKIR